MKPNPDSVGYDASPRSARLRELSVAQCLFEMNNALLYGLRVVGSSHLSVAKAFIF